MRPEDVPANLAFVPECPSCGAPPTQGHGYLCPEVMRPSVSIAEINLDGHLTWRVSVLYAVGAPVTLVGYVRVGRQALPDLDRLLGGRGLSLADVDLP